MRRILYGLIITTTTLLPTALHAQDATILSLKDAMDYAVKNNASAKNARLDVLMQNAKNRETTGIALPQINGEGKFTQFTDPQVSFFPAELLDAFNPPGTPPSPPGTFVPVTFTPVYATNATVSGSQILFNGSVMVALQARKAVMKLFEQTAQTTEEDIRYNVQKAYYAYVIATKQYDILKSSLFNARDILNDINALKEAGFAEKIEVDRMTVQVNNLSTDSIRIGGLIKLSEQVLKYRIGMKINQPIILIDTMVENNFTIARQLLEDDVNYENRTEYNLLLTQLQLNKYDLKRHRFSALPSLSLFGSAGYNYSSNSFDEITRLDKNYIFTSLWGLQLNVPVFDGLQRRSRVTQAKLSIEKTTNNIDNLKLGIDFQSEQSRTTLKNSLLTLENQQRNSELANSVLDLAKKKYKEGVGSNIEVTQAQTEYLQAQNNYFQAQLDVINAQADLQKALGQFK